MPTLNYNELNELPVGKFIGCAVQSDKEILLEADMSSLNIELTLNGKALDFQKVFSAFEKALGTVVQVQQSGPSAVRRDVYEGLLSTLESLNSEIYSVGSNIEDAFDRAADDAADVASERAREVVQEHSVGGDCLQDRLSSAVNRMRNAIEDLGVQE